METRKNLKKFYWKLESLAYEAWTRVMPIRTGKKIKNLDRDLIVSLTSYEPRFKKLILTLKCLLSQDVEPDRIILWVSYEDHAKIPISITNLSKKFKTFEIRQCEDIKSYKKLIPTLERFPNSYIVTADDDVYYPRSWLSSLIVTLPCTKTIVTHRAHKPKFMNGSLAPYNQWEHCVSQANKSIIMPTGIGGVLYTPECFVDQVFEEAKFMTLAPTADDIWFFWMARIKNTAIVLSGKKINIVTWIGTDTGGLAEKNVYSNENDLTIKRLEFEFGPLPTYNHRFSTFL
jgi:hypothetical protein